MRVKEYKPRKLPTIVGLPHHALKRRGCAIRLCPTKKALRFYFY